MVSLFVCSFVFCSVYIAFRIQYANLTAFRPSKGKYMYAKQATI